MERGKRPIFRGDMLTYSPVRVVFTRNVKGQHWAEAEIRILEDSWPRPAVEPCTLTTNPQPIKVKKRVRFGSFGLHLTRKPPAPQHIGRPIPQIKLATTAFSNPHNLQNVQKIQDLCASLKRIPSEPSECVGYISANAQHKYGLYLDTVPGSQQNWRTLTLEEVVTRMSMKKLSLGWRDKLKVAVELTSGVLQLYKTPWLKQNWQKSDVVFVRRPGDPSSAMFGHPFVYCSLQSRCPQSKQVTDARTYRVIRNATLYVLGLVLIELCYGQPMIKLQTAEDLQCEGTPGVAWCTANRLIERKYIEHQVGWRYADAVRRCIWCDFGVADADLENKRFQQAVYEGVLENLEEFLQYIEG